MKRYLLRRLVLAVLTLFLLSLVVFWATHLLPGNVGQKILGNFADRDAVALLNKQLGTDRPIPTQYVSWVGDTLTGDLGTSYKYEVPVTEKLRPAIGASLKLGAFAFLLVVPLSILGGALAALRKGKILDRIVSVGGLSAAVVPEFVWGVLFIVIFGVKLKWFPASARPDLGETPSIFSQYKRLFLPALSLVMILFGYIARITRTSVIEALDADYTRTARLKGLSNRQVLRKHVMRNALMPTIAVVAVQTVYLFGGLVAIEKLFDYRGFGDLLLSSIQNKDFPILQAGVLIIGVASIVTTLLADVLYTALNPRIRQSVLS
jgi:peptide/nickel transport system permease protein